MVVTAGPGGGGQELDTEGRSWRQDVCECQAVADQDFQVFSLMAIHLCNLSRAMGLWNCIGQ